MYQDSVEAQNAETCDANLSSSPAVAAFGGKHGHGRHLLQGAVGGRWWEKALRHSAARMLEVRVCCEGYRMVRLPPQVRPDVFMHLLHG